MDPSLIPFYKRPTGDNPNCVHLWNAGGKRSNKHAPKEHEPKVVVVNQTPIYVQTLTAVQAEATGIVGWDSVLADIAVMLPESVENRIVSFWADWKRKLRKSKTDAAAQRKHTRADVISKLPPNSSASPGAGDKRKCGVTPLSSEPVGKSSKQQYAQIAAKSSSKRAKKDHKEILWVHSTEEEKGPVSESIFFYVISRINAIKINAINNDDESHTWPPAIKGQPIYDHVNHRGKIVCTNQQTVDFWVKYIEMISPTISKVQLKAWTSKEYECKNAIYSCLIPNKTCNGIPTKAIIPFVTPKVWSDVSHPTLRRNSSESVSSKLQKNWQRLSNSIVEYSAVPTVTCPSNRGQVTMVGRPLGKKLWRTKTLPRHLCSQHLCLLQGGHLCLLHLCST